MAMHTGMHTAMRAVTFADIIVGGIEFTGGLDRKVR